MTTALDSSFFEFWIWTNHNSLLSIATNQFASFFIDIRSRRCYFRVCQSGEISNRRAFFPCILIFLLYKTNRFHGAVRLFSNRELTNRRLLSRRRLLVTSCLRSASRTIWRQNLITIPGRRLARSIFLVRCLCLCWKNIIHITVRETTREMSNLRETRNCIAYAYRKGFINDREFVLLYDANRSKNPDFPYWNYERFELDELTNAECNAEFRFYKHDIYKLADALQLPDEFVT